MSQTSQPKEKTNSSNTTPRPRDDFRAFYNTTYNVESFTSKRTEKNKTPDEEPTFSPGFINFRT